MNNRSLYALLGVVALIIVGLIVYNQSNQTNNTVSETNNANITEPELDPNDTIPTNIIDNSNTASSNTGTETTPGQFTDESDLDQGKVYEIKYNGTIYTPSVISINQGDTIVFKNQSESTFWPASAIHPEHTKYPEFDPKKPVASGENFEFKFLKIGEWGFHDHLRPSAFGKITVK